MKHVLRALTILFALLAVGASAMGATELTPKQKNRCAKNPSLVACKKKATPKPGKRAQRPPVQKRVVEASEPTGPLSRHSTLSRKQEEMREAFMECVGRATTENPTAGVVEFVFRTQQEREDGGLASFLRSLRGSTVHHGHEVCLVRAFGLKGFRDVEEVKKDTGILLVGINSPYVDVVESEIPVDRRVARVWVRDYVHMLAEDMHLHFSNHELQGIPFVPLRVTSMIRSFEEQEKTVRRGLSPADCRYEFLCSSHTSGSGIDLGLRNVSRIQREWLERRLLADQRARKIYFIRENSHYHVFVLPPMFMGEE